LNHGPRFNARANNLSGAAMSDWWNADSEISLAVYLKLARSNCGLTLKQVEDATQKLISAPYLCTVENGKIQKPSPTFLRALSSIYGVSFEALAFLAGYPPSGYIEDVQIIRLSEFLLSAAEEFELIRYLKFLRSTTKSPPEAFKSAQIAKNEKRSKPHKRSGRER
jgi:HTH-type transcriptional regulator, competence development regulator